MCMQMQKLHLIPMLTVKRSEHDTWVTLLNSILCHCVWLAVLKKSHCTVSSA